MNIGDRAVIATVIWLGLAAIPGGAMGSSTTTGVSRAMNPAISLNALFLGQGNFDTKTGDENYVKLQEAEIQFSSVVDPFWAADVVLSVHPAHGHDGAEAEGMASDLEIAVLRSTSMPAGFGLSLGKFYLPVGKHARLHTHQYPFTRAPLAQTSFLGMHGLSEVGAMIDYTVPLPWWSELSAYGVNGDAEIFDPGDGDPVVGGHWSNIWDVSEGGSLEIGGSYLRGPGAVHEDAAGTLGLTAADLSWKWIEPGRAHGRTMQLSFEIYRPEPAHAEGDPLGWFIHAQTGLKRNWWLGLGYSRVNDLSEEHDDHAKAVDPETPIDRHEWSAALTFAPSEYSALRAELSQTKDIGGDASDLRISVQWNFTIGSHPAHLY